MAKEEKKIYMPDIVSRAIDYFEDSAYSPDKEAILAISIYLDLLKVLCEAQLTKEQIVRINQTIEEAGFV